MEKLGGTATRPGGVFGFSLYGWFVSSALCCCRISCRSSIVNCWCENLSLWVNISLADNARPLIREFKLADTSINSWVVRERLHRSLRSVYSCSSFMTFSATEFVLVWPTSIMIRCCLRISSLINAVNPGVGSVLITANRPLRGRNSTHSLIWLSRTESWHSELSKVAAVKHVIHSLMTSVNWRRTSAENRYPIFLRDRIGFVVTWHWGSYVLKHICDMESSQSRLICVYLMRRSTDLQHTSTDD